MANSNLFEKYGIKEVCDVTFYRIERQEETYESQRNIAVSSILKGALTTKMVYPMENGVGSEDGFEAYVFEDAELITGRNYNCDDTVEVREVYSTEINATVDVTTITPATLTNYVDDEDLVTKVLVDNPTKTIPTNYTPAETPLSVKVTVISKNEPTEEGGTATQRILVSANRKYTSLEASTELDADKTIGTHEFSYEQQILMSFAKNQNLIDSTGTRYVFKSTDGIFGNIVFDSNFAATPNTTSKIVVVGLPGKMDSVTYDLTEVTDYIKGLTKTYPAKAYDVVYRDYAELIVENEMGYFDPAFLGSGVTGNKVDGFTEGVTGQTYENWANALRGADVALSLATTWGDTEHESINDAIDALREKRMLLDVGADSSLRNINKVFGGYKVQKGKVGIGEIDTDDDIYENNKYAYMVGTAQVGTSKYALADVLDCLNKIAVNPDVDLIQNPNIKVTLENEDAEPSNRAIYIDTIGAANIAASAYIYLLTNKNERRIATDKDGIFWFIDRKGNKVYYQDKIFAGVKNLALVIIGNKGLIFIANRYGTKDINKIAWMVNENGYLTNTECKTVVDNGIIHTVDVTEDNETFDATCTLKSMKIRKTAKTVNRYVPVLFLDTLKVSTLEQTAEQTAAEGGKGNSQLIIWDYGKEITLTLEDALYSPASMSAMIGSYEGNDFTKGVKTTKRIDRTEKCIAKRSFIVPAGNSKGVPSEGDLTAQAVYYDLSTMQPYQDGAPIAEGEVYLKFTRSIAYGDNSLGNTIEISADKFPGTYKVVGDTYSRNKTTGEDQRFQFVIPQAKMTSEQTITLEAEGDPSVFNLNMTVLRPDDGVMVKLIQYDVVENEEENDGSTMVKGTENLNLLDDAEMYRVNADTVNDENYIGATEY